MSLNVQYRFQNMIPNKGDLLSVPWTVLDFHISAFSTRDSPANQCALLLPLGVSSFGEACLIFLLERLQRTLALRTRLVSVQSLARHCVAFANCPLVLAYRPLCTHTLHSHTLRCPVSLCDLFYSVSYPCTHVVPFCRQWQNCTPLLNDEYALVLGAYHSNNRSPQIDYVIGYLLFVSQAKVAIYWLLTRGFSSLGFAWWSPFN